MDIPHFIHSSVDGLLGYFHFEATVNNATMMGKESACNAGGTGDAVRSLGREDPLEKEMAPHSSILA